MFLLKPHGFKEPSRIIPNLDKLTEQTCLSYFIETIVKHGQEKIKYILVDGEFNQNGNKKLAVITNKWYILYPEIYSIPNNEIIVNEIEGLYKKDSFISQCFNWLKP